MLIGIYSSVPQSGKSTVADHLCRAYRFERRPFAAILKEMAEVLCDPLGFSRGLLYEGDKSHEVYQGKTLRHLLQTLGTEWGRKCMGDNFWVDLWTAQVRRALLNDTHIVADDMRFPNEMTAVQALGGWTWKVVRPGGAAATHGHASEGALDGLLFDTELVNAGSLADLRVTVDAALRAGRA